MDACCRACGLLLDETNGVEKAVELDAKTDAEATEQARQLVAEHPVELWDRSRMVIRLEPKWHEAEGFGYFSSSAAATEMLDGELPTQEWSFAKMDGNKVRLKADSALWGTYPELIDQIGTLNVVPGANDEALLNVHFKQPTRLVVLNVAASDFEAVD